MMSTKALIQKSKKYSIEKFLKDSSMAREQINENQMDMNDFNDSEFEGIIKEILEYHWDFVLCGS